MHYNFSSYNLSGDSVRLYAVAVFLPRVLDQIVARLRERFDPEYNMVDSHVTVVFPFESKLSVDRISGLIREDVSNLGPLVLCLSSIGDFYPSAPIIFWRVEDNAALNALHKNLYARLDLALPHRKYIPHVTIAREISPHRVMLVKEKIIPYLSDERFHVRAVDLLSPVSDHKWVSVRTFPLPQP